MRLPIATAVVLTLLTPALATPIRNEERGLDLSAYDQAALNSAVSELETTHDSVPALNLTSSALTDGKRPAVLDAVQGWVKDHFSSSNTKRDLVQDKGGDQRKKFENRRRVRRGDVVLDVDAALAGDQKGVTLSPMRFLRESGDVVFGAETLAEKRGEVIDVDEQEAGEQKGISLDPVRFLRGGGVVFGDDSLEEK